jgi:hypothetical protein
MTVTETQLNPLNTLRLATGRILDTGTVASTFPVDVELGFKPRYVCVENVTSGDKMEWYEGMTDATAVKTVAAGTRSILSSLGITVTATGFEIGLDTDVVYTSEQVTWLALG